VVFLVLMEAFQSFIFLRSRDLPERVGDEDVPRGTT
jgi:hypothetical protein